MTLGPGVPALFLESLEGRTMKTKTTYKAKITINRKWITFEHDERRDEMDLRDIGHEWANEVERKLGALGFVADVGLSHGQGHDMPIFADVEGVKFWPTSHFDNTPKFNADSLDTAMNSLETDAEESGESFDREATEAAFIAAAREAFDAVDKAMV